MPRLIDARRCPHCGEDLPPEVPRTCSSCGGSLQQRYLKAGCLTSAPGWVFLVGAAWSALHALGG
ncbi:MAG: hypothetical protein ISQ08_11870 [Planctomycetes bacterium]|nr:hypothetical protein [Planctomycetota bacterium]MDA0948017.1 hypothetical protein [Planctomycetota bacterium]